MINDNTITIRYWINTGFANCKHEDSIEIDREFWQSMNTHEKASYMGELYNELIDDHIEGGYKIDGLE